MTTSVELGRWVGRLIRRLDKRVLIAACALAAVVLIVLIALPPKEPPVAVPPPLSLPDQPAAAAAEPLPPPPDDPCAGMDTAKAWDSAFKSTSTEEQNQRAYIKLLRTWPAECRENALLKGCTPDACNPDLDMVLRAASGAEAAHLRNIYGAMIAKAAADNAALVAKITREEKESDKRMDALIQKCSGKNMMDVCCGRACDGSQSIERCLGDFYRQGCSAANGMNITCSCP